RRCQECRLHLAPSLVNKGRTAAGVAAPRRTHFRFTCLAVLIHFLMEFSCGAGSLSAADDEPVSGVFKGNGKEAKLAYVSTRKGEPFADKPTIIITFTEKDHSKVKKPDIKAGFGDFGSALIITVNNEGKIIGCVVAHAASR